MSKTQTAGSRHWRALKERVREHSSDRTAETKLCCLEDTSTAASTARLKVPCDKASAQALEPWPFALLHTQPGVFIS